MQARSPTPLQLELPRVIEIPQQKLLTHLQHELKLGSIRIEDVETISSKINSRAPCKWRPTDALKETNAILEYTCTRERILHSRNAYLVLDIMLENGIMIKRGVEVSIVDQDNIGAFGVVFDVNSTDVLWIRSHNVARRVRFFSC
jgi:hypothetical protein